MKKLNKKNMLIIVSIIIFLILMSLFFGCFLLSLKLKGDNITLNVFEKYKEPGFNAKFIGNNISNKVKIENNINNKKIGTYKVIYKINMLIFIKKKIRIVEVLDKEKPIITLKGNKNIEICPNKEYKEEGYKVIDNYDKNITKKVTIVNKKNNITYKVKDSSGNLAIAKRTINKIDKEKPILTLNGDDNIYILKGEKYEEKSINIEDNCDTDLKVEIIGKVDTNINGKYTITYKVKDLSNNESSITRNIIVYTKSNKISSNFYNNIVEGPKYIKGILIVNKNYSLPSNYNPGVDKNALEALNKLQNQAVSEGYSINTLSSFRSYNTQYNLYNKYVKMYGVNEADKISARPGHSEHQTGLAFDVGKIDNNYGATEPGIWLTKNAYKFGFIIRYPKGKENITGYSYEPWHIRYVGIEASTYIYNNNITLEEYLNI